MKRKIVAIGAVIAAASLALSACGTDSSKSSGTSGAGGGTISSSMIFGGPAEFKTRSDGIPGLEKKYGVSFGKYTVTDTGGPATVNALKQGQIDAADLFTTDPAIEANGFVVLEDPKNNFSAQNVVPIINKEKATDGVKKVLNAVSAKITTKSLIELRTKVETDKQDADKAAAAWVKEQGLDAAGSDAKGATLKIGSANFPENVILAYIYSAALNAQGASTTVQDNIGSREKYFPGLEDGSIDLFPEYSGTVLTYLDKTATAVSSEDVAAALAKVLPKSLIALDYAEAQDADAIVVTKATADKYSLKTIEDLSKKA